MKYYKNIKGFIIKWKVVALLTLIFGTLTPLFWDYKEHLFPEDKDAQLKNIAVSNLLSALREQNTYMKVCFRDTCPLTKKMLWLKSDSGVYQTIPSALSLSELPFIFKKEDWKQRFLQPTNKQVIIASMQAIDTVNTPTGRKNIIEFEAIDLANDEKLAFYDSYSFTPYLFDKKVFDCLDDPYLPDSFKAEINGLKSISYNIISLRKAFTYVDTIYGNPNLLLFSKENTDGYNSISPEDIIYTMKVGETRVTSNILFYRIYRINTMIYRYYINNNLTY